MPVAIGLVAILALVRRGSPPHDARLDAQCRELRAAPGNQDAAICAPVATTHAIARATEARALIGAARSALASGDRPRAREDLERVVAMARELPRREKMLGGLVGASIVRQVLDVLEAAPEALDRADQRAILARAELADVGALLASERAQWLWSYTQPDTADADALAAGLEGDDRVLAAMTRALARGDVAACRRATDGIVPDDRRRGMRTQCAALAHVTATRARLAGAQLALQ